MTNTVATIIVPAPHPGPMWQRIVAIMDGNLQYCVQLATPEEADQSERDHQVHHGWYRRGPDISREDAIKALSDAAWDDEDPDDAEAMIDDIILASGE